MELKKKYEGIRGKYNLPSFDDINSEFEICAIEVDKINSLPKAILRVICNRMGIYLNYLEPVVSPNPQGLHAFVEVENTTNEEKKDLFNFYKSLSYRYHKAYSLELVESEENVVKEIKDDKGSYNEPDIGEHKKNRPILVEQEDSGNRYLGKWIIRYDPNWMDSDTPPPTEPDYDRWRLAACWRIKSAGLRSSPRSRMDCGLPSVTADRTPFVSRKIAARTRCTVAVYTHSGSVPHRRHR